MLTLNCSISLSGLGRIVSVILGFMLHEAPLFHQDLRALLVGDKWQLQCVPMTIVYTEKPCLLSIWAVGFSTNVGDSAENSVGSVVPCRLIYSNEIRLKTTFVRMHSDLLVDLLNVWARSQSAQAHRIDVQHNAHACERHLLIIRP
jgi:hypothetical protein